MKTPAVIAAHPKARLHRELVAGVRDYGSNRAIVSASKAKQGDQGGLCKRRILCAVQLIALVLLCLPSCATLKEVDNADDFLDLVMIFTHTAKPEVVPIEKATTGDGEIATARAVLDGDHVSVRGSVRKRFGAGWVSGAYSHIDVLVLDSHRRVIEAKPVHFSPAEIPNNLPGQEGRSRFYATLRAISGPRSLIRIIFHNVPEEQCEFSFSIPATVRKK